MSSELVYKTLEDILTELKALSPEYSHDDICKLEAGFTLVKDYAKQWETATVDEISKRATTIRDESFCSSEQDFISELIAFLDRANELATNGHRLKLPQILVLLLAQRHKNLGQVFQVQAGEGKKTIGAVLAAMKIILGAGPVDIITPSGEFAREAVKEASEFYKLLGISVGLNPEGNCSFLDGPEGVVPDPDCDVLYGTLCSFQCNYLRHRFRGDIVHGKRPRSALILDSIDTLLIDENEAQVCKLSTPFRSMDSLHQVYIQIWNGIHLAERTAIETISSVLGKTQADIKRRVEAQELREEEAFAEEARKRETLMKGSYEKIKQIVKESCTKILTSLPDQIQKFVETFLSSWINTALQVKHCFVEGQDYCIRAGNGGDLYVVPLKNRVAGQIQSTVWTNAMLQFLYLKHKLPLKSAYLPTLCFSNISYLKSYQSNIICLTKSIGSQTEQDLLQNLYNIQFTRLPTSLEPFEPKRLEEYEQRMLRDQNWVYEICHLADNIAWYKGRAVVIVCKTVTDCNNIEKCFKFMDSSKKEQAPHFESLRKFTEQDSEPFPLGLQTLRSGDVVIATLGAVKRIRFMASSDLEKFGGLHISLCFLPCNAREKAEAIANLSRNSTGSYQLVVRRSEIQSLINHSTSNCSQPSTQNQSDSPSNAQISSENIWMDVQNLLEDVDQIRNNYLKCALKDFQLFQDQIFEIFARYYAEHTGKSDLAPRSVKFLEERWTFWVHQQLYLEALNLKLGHFENAAQHVETKNGLCSKAESLFKEFLEYLSTLCSRDIDRNPMSIESSPPNELQIITSAAPELVPGFDSHSLNLYCREGSGANQRLHLRATFKSLTTCWSHRSALRHFTRLELLTKENLILSTFIGLYCMDQVIFEMLATRINGTQLKPIMKFVVENSVWEEIDVEDIIPPMAAVTEICAKLLKKRQLYLWKIMEDMYKEMNLCPCDWRWKGTLGFKRYGQNDDFPQFCQRYGRTLRKKLNPESRTLRSINEDAQDMKEYIDNLLTNECYNSFLLSGFQYVEDSVAIPCANSFKLQNGLLPSPLPCKSSQKDLETNSLQLSRPNSSQLNSQNTATGHSDEFLEDDEISEDDDHEFVKYMQTKLVIYELANINYIEREMMEKLGDYYTSMVTMYYRRWDFARIEEIQTYVFCTFLDSSNARTKPEFTPLVTTLTDCTFGLLSGGHRLSTEKIVHLLWIGITGLESHKLDEATTPTEQANPAPTDSNDQKNIEIISPGPSEIQGSSTSGPENEDTATPTIAINESIDDSLLIKPYQLVLAELKGLNPELSSCHLKRLDDQFKMQIESYETWKQKLKSKADFSPSFPGMEKLIDTPNMTEVTPKFIGLMERIWELLSGRRLRIPQIICLLELSGAGSSRQICQVRAGEGKTVVIAMLAIIKCLLGETYVDVITNSMTLAEEAFTKTSSLFHAFGLTVGTISVNTKACKEAHKSCNPVARVLYGDIQSFQKNFLNNSAERSSLPGSSRQAYCAILDEIDCIQISTNENNTCELPAPPIATESFKRLHYYIWDKLEEAEAACISQMELDLNNLSVEQDKILGNRKSRARNYFEAEETFCFHSDWDLKKTKLKEKLVSEAFEKIKNLTLTRVRTVLSSLPAPLYDYMVSTLDRRVENAIRAKYILKRDVDYCTQRQEGQKDLLVIPIKELNASFHPLSSSDSEKQCSQDQKVNYYSVPDTSPWAFGMLQFLQLKHSVQVTNEDLPLLRISNLGYLSLYRSFIGITHTYGSATEQTFLKNLFGGTQFLNIPTHKVLTIDEFEGTVIDDPNFPYDMAFNASKIALRHQRAALILCNTISDCNDVAAALEFIQENPAEQHGAEATAKFSSISVFSQNKEGVPPFFKILHPGDVVVATMAAIRGVRFFTSPEVEEAGGLHVTIGYYPPSQLVEDEALSHLFRLGNGSYQISLCETDVEVMIAQEARSLHRLKDSTLAAEDEKEETNWRDLDGAEEELSESTFFQSLKKSSQAFEHERYESLLNASIPLLLLEDELFAKFADYFNKEQNITSMGQILILKQSWGLWINTLLNMGTATIVANDPELQGTPPANQAHRTNIVNELFNQFLDHYTNVELLDSPGLNLDLDIEIPYAISNALTQDHVITPELVFSVFGQRNKRDPLSYKVSCDELKHLKKYHQMYTRFIFKPQPATLVGLQVLEKAIQSCLESGLNSSGRRALLRSAIEENHYGFLGIKLLTLLTNGFMPFSKFHQFSKELLKLIEPFLWEATKEFKDYNGMVDNEFTKAIQEFYKGFVQRLDLSSFFEPQLEEHQLDELLSYTVELMTAKAFEMLQVLLQDNWNSTILFQFESYLKNRVESEAGPGYESHVKARRHELFMFMRDTEPAKEYTRRSAIDQNYLQMKMYLNLMILEKLRTTHRLEGGRTVLYELSMFLQTPISVNGEVVDGWAGNTIGSNPTQPIELVSFGEDAPNVLVLKGAEGTLVPNENSKSYFLQRLDTALQQQSYVSDFLKTFAISNRAILPSASQFSYLRSKDLFFVLQESENRLGETQRVRAELAGRLAELLEDADQLKAAGGHALSKHVNVRAAQSYLGKHPDLLNLTTFQGRASLLEAFKRCLRVVRNKRSWLKAGADYEINVDASYMDKSFKMVKVQRKKGAPGSGKSGLQYKLQKAKYFTLVVGYRIEKVDGRSRRTFHLQSIFPRDERPVKLKQGKAYCIDERKNVTRAQQQARGRFSRSNKVKEKLKVPDTDFEGESFSLFED